MIHATFSKAIFLHAPDPVPLVEVLPSEEVDDRGELELDRDGYHVLVPGIHV